jgi:5'-methylthioinosine phosphorylase
VTDTLGLIVGSGLAFSRLEIASEQPVSTRYGEPSSPLLRARIGGREVVCIARHGRDGHIAPHAVNYRANLSALHAAGVTACIGVNVVGAIEPELEPGGLAVPEQLIDYTWGRDGTFVEPGGAVVHIDLTEPFDVVLRGRLEAAAAARGLEVRRGTYGVTQGPRLETAAEIDRLERDGCTMVGMTAMPEAALARELELRYAVCAAAVNYAAGRSPTGRGIHAELEQYATLGMSRIFDLLEEALASPEDRKV